MNNIIIIGAFDFSGLDTGGQPVKTRELYYALKEYYPNAKINYVDTFNWIKKSITTVYSLFKNIRKCDVIIMLPAHRGVGVFSRFLLLFKKKNTRLYYDVVGGWLPEKLNHNKKLIKLLEKFDGIWVESTSMKSDLIKLGLNNVTVVRNFKRLKAITIEQLVNDLIPPLRLCIFSRVMLEKGIEDAVRAVESINNKYQKTMLSLDIYGLIDVNYKEQFEAMIKGFPKYIVYKGIVSPNKSVDVLSNYFALLFPTRFFYEGIPGTIIDAFSSGIPVIASRWRNYSDVIEEGKTGWGYEFENYNNFVILLEKVVNNPIDLITMKKNCLNEAEKYKPEMVVRDIIKLINR
jgi:glycosyltransferase involved in cell wall biosynthesis